jgi:hypothetical protein
MWQDVADDVIQIRFAASDSARRTDSEIDRTGITQSCERLRRVLDARLECDLMNWAEDDAVALGNTEQPSGLVRRLSQWLLDESVNAGFEHLGG